MSEIEQEIESAETLEQEVPETENQEPEAVESPEEEVRKDDAQKDETDTAEDNVVFPKKAINALSRRDKQIGKLRAELAAERAAIQKFQAQAQTSKTAEPNVDSYDNYGEYMKAVARYEIQQEQTQNQEQERNQQLSEKQQAWIVERESYTVNKAEDAISKIPDYQQLLMENLDIVHSIPPQIEQAFYESDEPALAFYVLAKEGKLEALMEMSPARAAIEIGKAEARAATHTRKQTTNAPPPISKAKGAVQTNRPMTADEVMAWVNS